MANELYNSLAHSQDTQPSAVVAILLKQAYLHGRGESLDNLPELKGILEGDRLLKEITG